MKRFFLPWPFTIVLIAFTICFHSFANAQAMTCSALMNKTLAEKLSAEVEDRIGARGLLTSVPDYDPALVDVLGTKLISYWGIEIYVMPSIEAAREHDRIANRPYKQGLYLIDPKADFAKINLNNRAQGEEIFREILSHKPEAVFFKADEYYSPVEERKTRIVSSDQVQKVIVPEGVILRDRDLKMGPHFMRMGWFYPKDVYGVFEFKDLWESSSTFKKLMSRARKIHREGVIFEFSQTEAQFREDLAIASETERKDQNTKGNGYYTQKQNVDRAVTQFVAGEAFTIRAVQNGKSLGGIVVFRHGNRVDFSTTFYQDDGGILYAQIAAVVLFQRLEAMGIKKLYIEMISEYSAGLKAKRASMQDGFAATEELERRSPIPYDFKTSWTPPGIE